MLCKEVPLHVVLYILRQDLFTLSTLFFTGPYSEEQLSRSGAMLSFSSLQQFVTKSRSGNKLAIFGYLHQNRSVQNTFEVRQKVESMFVKHYVPNQMLAPKDNGGIIKILRNLSKKTQSVC